MSVNSSPNWEESSEMQVGFTIEQTTDALVETYMAKLVTNGYSQTYEDNYQKTFCSDWKITWCRTRTKTRKMIEVCALTAENSTALRWSNCAVLLGEEKNFVMDCNKKKKIQFNNSIKSLPIKKHYISLYSSKSLKLAPK